MNKEQEYMEMIEDTSQLLAKEKTTFFGETATAVKESGALVNEVEFWKWMGANYPKDLSSTDLIQKAAEEKARWLNTQLQGKGYEWDYMALQRTKPDKILSAFEAGDCPTQPGIDITESSILDRSVKGTYQNKAYLSSNNPNLHNTPKEAVVVTNSEKVAYARKQGYVTEEYMDADEIANVRDARFQKASKGQVSTTYNFKNVALSSAKAGVVGAAVGITVETVASYKRWKSGEITDQEYLKEVLKAGGEAGATAGFTSAAMIPVQSAVTVAGASTLLTIPIAFVFGTVISSVIAPCFGRGKYRKILAEAKYYQALEKVYDDFLKVVEQSANQYQEYMSAVIMENKKFRKMQDLSKEIDKNLEKIYQSI